MELAIYAHPWDLRDLPAPGGLQRLVDLGFGEVAMATAYHAGRWLTPWSASGMVRFLEDGTVHFRPRGEYGRLQPQPSSEVGDGPSPLERLCEQAGAAGLRVRAWTVFCHNTRLGELHRESCVENAFGDRYTYALCPARPEVRQYCASLLADIVAHHGVHAVELEAFGWLGHRHNCHHDKNSFPPEPFTDCLLSMCFCSVCSAGMAAQAKAAGFAVDVAALRERVRGLLRQAFTEGDAMAPVVSTLAAAQARLTAELDNGVQAWLAHKGATLTAALAQAAEIVGRTGPLPALQAAWDPLLATFSPQLLPAAELVVTCYGQGPDGVAAALASFGNSALPRAQRLRLALHPKAPQFRSDDDLRRAAELARQHGVTSIAIYHLGLLPWRTLERAAKALHR